MSIVDHYTTSQTLGSDWTSHLHFLSHIRFISPQGLLKTQLLRNAIKRKVVLSYVETVSYLELVHGLSHKRWGVPAYLT